MRARPVLDRWIVHPVNYWVGFLCHVATGLFTLGFGLGRADAALGWVVPGWALGWLTWTFLEYAVHRWVFHGPIAPALRGHAIHHQRPKATVGVPFFVPGLLGLGIWLGLRPLVGELVAGAWVAGTMFAYTSYGLLHHAQHQVRFRGAWMRRLQLEHLVHHARPDTNYGVTTRLWDVVFGTAERRPAR